jgi:NAD(P)-dependent dehydrogenase (short-subunit alcohol dehydrogenase family)
MDLRALWGYEGKNCVVVGAASGMGKAATELLLELGANVYAADFNEVAPPVKQAFRVDMSDKDQIDQLLTQLPDRIDKVFTCHGIAMFPGNAVKVMLVNFISHRYFIEALLPRISEKGAVCMIASDGGYGWQHFWGFTAPLLATKTFEEAHEWAKANEEEIEKNMSYCVAKRAQVSYMKANAWAPEFIGKYIRINTISPGATQTGLTADFNKSAGQGDEAAGDAGIRGMYLTGWNGWYAMPEDMGYPMVFINSDMAGYISGQDLNISYGIDASRDVAALNAGLQSG